MRAFEPDLVISDAEPFTHQAAAALGVPRIGFDHFGILSHCRPTAPKECGPKGCVVKSVLWTNLAFAKEPVNQTVKAVSLMGFDDFAKAIAAGYGTDSAQLSGGAALRRESLHGATVETAQPDYKAAAGRVLTAIRKPGTAQCAHFDSPPTVASLVAHFEQCERADPATARAHAARLILEAKQHARHARHSAALAA